MPHSQATPLPGSLAAEARQPQQRLGERLRGEVRGDIGRDLGAQPAVQRHRPARVERREGLRVAARRAQLRGVVVVDRAHRCQVRGHDDL